MSDNHVNDYMGQGLSRLSKEKLVEIISGLQNMPHELAMKTMENVPEFFKMCSDTMAKIDSAYKKAIEGVEHDTQQVIDMLSHTRSLYEKSCNEAETDEQRELYKSWVAEQDQKIQEAKKEGEEARKYYFKLHASYIAGLTALAAASIGVTIKMGKRFR